jgi:glycine cleavage system transcriptional repressor
LVTYLAITVLGHDRLGIIAQTAEILADCGMNLEDSSMTLLRGHFAMTLICAGDLPRGEIELALAPLTADGGLTVSVRELPPEPEHPASGEEYLLSVHGADRLGIVAALTGVVAEAGGNIIDLTTRLAGGLYVLAAEVDLPQGCDVSALDARINEVAGQLGVDASLRAIERDEL